ncbi:DHH family phosphoesterase [Peptoniphilus mikwangii]|uniref:DHH family phosphoesterase n=1 Tax=Peptoniphilus mikwangii TaxID=1354300 RepID=UPI00040C300F|nr:DHH family phosphoesterase [Peptoniphilus mikwangii]
MEDKYTLNSFKPYLIFSTIVVLILLYLWPIVGAVAMVIYVYIVYLSAKMIESKNQTLKKYVEDINVDFDTVTKHTIFSMPFPLVVIDDKGKINWYNSQFLNIFSHQDIMNTEISSLISEINVESIIDKNVEESFYVTLNENKYKVYEKIVDVNKSASDRKKMLIFYFIDSTEYAKLEQKYIDENAIVAKIEVDNFDDAMDSTPSNNRPQLIAEIDSTVRDYFNDFNALVRKFDSDMYLVIMSNKSLNQIKEKRFDLLDDLRELDKGNTIPITLSIGVSSFGLSFRDAYEESDTCLDLALGRGGDQAVVKVADNYEFFGGKSKAVEKRNKVKARVLGIALRQLIDGAKDVFIMGHKNADMDAIGSAIGILRAALNREKEGYIVLNSSNPSIDNLILRMKEEEPDLYNRIVKEDFAANTINAKSLLILVDNHKPSFTEAPDLLKLTPQVVIIDHHRRGKEFVDNPVLTYIEPYASSASELVTEMLTYMNDDLNITHFEADALMSGIVVDTKNFSFQTGVRTFEAASTLKRAGADMLKVKQLFQDDLDTMLNRAEVVHNTKIVFDEIAISRLEREAENSILISAQAADELLEITGIRASFVMTMTDTGVHISGRSKGNISVQLILERIGGGGHLNMAGAQLAVNSLDEAEDILLRAIEEYINDNRGDKK